MSPDVFVAFGPNKEPERRIWKVWEEGKAADFVLDWIRIPCMAANTDEIETVLGVELLNFALIR